jgi:hypothetical protein
MYARDRGDDTTAFKDLRRRAAHGTSGHHTSTLACSGPPREEASEASVGLERSSAPDDAVGPRSAGTAPQQPSRPRSDADQQRPAAPSPPAPVPKMAPLPPPPQVRPMSTVAKCALLFPCLAVEAVRHRLRRPKAPWWRLETGGRAFRAPETIIRQLAPLPLRQRTSGES